MAQRGRPKGSKNKITAIKEKRSLQLIRRYGEVGSPDSIIDAMWEHHSFWLRKALKEQNKGAKKNDALIETARRLSLLALEKMAPYCTARLSSVKIVDRHEEHSIIDIEMRIGDSVKTVTHQIDGNGHSTLIDVTPQQGEPANDDPNHLPDLQPGD